MTLKQKVRFENMHFPISNEVSEDFEEEYPDVVIKNPEEAIELFCQYLGIQKRIRELDMSIYNNITYVEKELLPEIKTVEKLCESLANRQEELINLGIDITEEEEVIAEKMTEYLGDTRSETETIIDKINNLHLEKNQLVSDIANIKLQQQDILAKKEELRRAIGNPPKSNQTLQPNASFKG